MFMEKTLVLTLFSMCFLSSAAKENKTFPALFAFGDSVLDTGNNNFLHTLLKANFWPYGRNFLFKRATGRFGNGRVFTDIIDMPSRNSNVVKSCTVAEGLGIKKMVPAYHQHARIKPNDLKTGVCFASGGSGIDDLTSRTLRVFSTGDQIKDFNEYLKKLKRVVKDKKKVEEIISKAVFLISEGNNDLGHFTAQAIVQLYSPSEYTSKMVVWTKQFLKDLYDKGARKFAVMGVMPVGCSPFHRLVFSGIFRWCNFFLNQITQDFNTKLREGLQTYGDEDDFKGAKFVYVDIYGTLMDLINNPKAFGFTEAKNACCCMVTAIIPCKDPDQYIYYDYAHPSQEAYEVISKPLLFQIRKGLA